MSTRSLASSTVAVRMEETGAMLALTCLSDAIYCMSSWFSGGCATRPLCSSSASAGGLLATCFLVTLCGVVDCFFLPDRTFRYFEGESYSWL